MTEQKLVGFDEEQMKIIQSYRRRERQLEEKVERLENALQEIANWSDAYPLDIFPEPDFKRVRELLEDGGITIDCVSASNFRHVITGVGEIAKKALKG